jgi:hypothetical protein
MFVIEALLVPENYRELARTQYLFCMLLAGKAREPNTTTNCFTPLMTAYFSTMPTSLS